MSEPTYGEMTELAYERIPDHFQQVDPDNDMTMKKLMHSILVHSDLVGDLVDRFAYVSPEDGPGQRTSQLIDPRYADNAWLQWLAPLLGTRPSSDPETMRAQMLRSIEAFNAGTKEAMIAVAQSVLAGDRYVALFPQTLPGMLPGGPWDMLIITRASETLINLLPEWVATSAIPSIFPQFKNDFGRDADPTHYFYKHSYTYVPELIYNGTFETNVDGWSATWNASRIESDTWNSKALFAYGSGTGLSVGAVSDPAHWDVVPGDVLTISFKADSFASQAPANDLFVLNIAGVSLDKSTPGWAYDGDGVHSRSETFVVPAGYTSTSTASLRLGAGYNSYSPTTGEPVVIDDVSVKVTKSIPHIINAQTVSADEFYGKQAIQIDSTETLSAHNATYTLPRFPVFAGDPLTVMFSYQSLASTTGQVTAGVIFYNSSGAQLNSVDDQLDLTTTEKKQLVLTASAPVDAVSAGVFFTQLCAPGIPVSFLLGEFGARRESETDWVPRTSDVVQTLIDYGAKPAGLKLRHQTFASGWDQIEAAFPTWDDIELTDWRGIEEAGA